MKKLFLRIAVLAMAGCVCLGAVGCGKKTDKTKKSDVVGTYYFDDLAVDFADNITEDEKETARAKLKEEVGKDLTDTEYFAEYVKLKVAERENSEEKYRFDSDHTGIHTKDGVKQSFSWSESDNTVTLTEGGETVKLEYKSDKLTRKITEDGLVKTETYKKKS